MTDSLSSSSSDTTPMVEAPVASPDAATATLPSSPVFSLNAKNWKAVGKHLLFVATAALFTALIQWVDNTNFGAYNLIAVSVASPLLKLAYEWVTAQQTQV